MPTRRALTRIERQSLDLAVKRFPNWIAQWRVHAIQSKDLHALVPMIIAEYHRIVTKELPNA
jgi:hypothetical protein